MFSNHKGYVFHDSQGFEAGDEEKLEILEDFIRRECGGKRLQDKLHAIWFVSISTIAATDYHGFRYCVPMDGHRPWLDLRFYKSICPDQNGALSRKVMTVFNARLQILSSSCHCSVHQI